MAGLEGPCWCAASDSRPVTEARLLGYPERAPTLFGSPLPGLLLYLLVAGAARVAAALVSWHLIEKHFLALKDRLAPGRTPGTPDAAGHDGDPRADRAGASRPARAVAPTVV